jgi:N-acetylglucosamine kinase-like BadF-type ATPase
MTTRRKDPPVAGAARTGLGVDCGGRSARWHLAVRSEAGDVVELGAGRTGPLSGRSLLPSAHRDDRAAVMARISTLASEVRRLLREHGGARAPDAIVAAMPDPGPGSGPGDAASEAVCGSLADAIGTPRDRIVVADVLALAYGSVFAPGEGILVHADDDAAAVHLGGDGRLQRVGGHGPRIDGAGGAVWIGRRVLRAVAREVDLRDGPPASVLAQEIVAALAARDWSEVRRTVEARGTAATSALIPALARAHARGDRSAVAIVARTGRELARLARLASDRLDAARPIVVAGAVAALGPPLLEAMRAALPPGTPLDAREVDPALLASRQAVGAVGLPSGPGGALE